MAPSKGRDGAREGSEDDPFESMNGARFVHDELERHS